MGTDQSTTTEAALEPCRWCAKGDKPKFLDADGTLVSITGNDGVMCHAYEDAWWPCLKFGTEIRCARIPAPSVAPEVDVPLKLINFLTVLEHQAHRNHEYRPTECGECSLTKTIADRIRKELGD